MAPAQQRRRAYRAKRAAEEFRKLNFHMIGSRHANAGYALEVGTEWETPDGFLVRQIEVTYNHAEAGHFYGIVEVLDFAQRLKEHAHGV